MLPNSLHTSRPRSKSLGDINNRQKPTYDADASEQIQEDSFIWVIRPRSAWGHLYPASSHKTHSTVENDERLDSSYRQVACHPTYEEVFGENIEDIFEDASQVITKADDEGDNNTWPPSTSKDQLQDQDASSWSSNLCSTPPTPTSPNTTPLMPLPSPNDLTSTYLPFSFHLALSSHFTLSTLCSFQQTHTTPIFLHSILQLPSTLAHILSLRTSDVLCRLTPSILLDYTTVLEADTLLPSLIPTTNLSIYHHVNGLLYLPSSPDAVVKIDEFLASTHNIEGQMRKSKTQVRDSEGKRHEISAWAWVAEEEEGTEEWWTLEDFVAGRVVGLGAVEW